MRRNLKNTLATTVMLGVLASPLSKDASPQHRRWWMKGGKKLAIRVDDLRKYVIRPALSPYGLWSDVAEELLLLTAAQESKLGYYLHQLGDGPALGPWQMEPDTFNWLRDGTTFEFVNPLKGRHAEEMMYDLRLAAVAARLRYYIDPVALPATKDAATLAQLWKRVYNTSAGKGKWEEAAEAYQHYVQDGRQ